MEQNIEIKVEKGAGELIIRKGEAAPVVKFKKGLVLAGNLDVPLNYLKNPPKWFNEFSGSNGSPLEFSFLKVDRDANKITLIVDQGTEWEDSYTGALCYSEAYELFKINTGSSFTTFDLADLIKMNRSCFESKDKAMVLVNELRSFKAKVDKDLENMDDQRGNKRFLVAQVIDSNVPDVFNLVLPIFKGYDKQTFEVEVAINASDFSCTLISPEVNDYIDEVKNELIDEQLASIKELFEGLKVFEV